MHFFGKLSLGALVVSLGGCIALWDLDEYDHPIADGNTGGGGGSVSGGGGGNTTCGLNDKRECYTPGLEVERVGACKTGFESCIEEGWSGICAGEVTPIAGEICRNGVQDTCNKNLPDADCVLDPAERRRIGTAGHEAALTVATVPGGLGAVIGGEFTNSIDFDGIDPGSAIDGTQGFIAYIDNNGSAKWAIPVDASTANSKVQSVAIGQDGIFVGMSYTAQNGEAALAFRAYESSAGLATTPSKTWSVPIQPVYVPKTGGPTTALVAPVPNQTDTFVVGVLGAFPATASLPTCDSVIGNMMAASPANIFVMQLDSTGTCKWMQVIDGGTDQAPRAIAYHQSGAFRAAVYIAGSYSGGVNWPSVKNDKGADGGIFIMKVDTGEQSVAPSVTWTRTFPNSGTSTAFSITSASEYGIVFGGEFKGSVEFISGSTTQADTTDAFIALMDPDAAVQWVRHLPSVADSVGAGIRRISGVGYANATIYATGTFDGSIDVDPLNNTPNNASDIVTDGSSSAFFASLNPANGNLRWFDIFASGGAPPEDHAYLAADANNVVLTGAWSANLELRSTQELLGNGLSDIYFGSYTEASLP